MNFVTVACHDVQWPIVRAVDQARGMRLVVARTAWLADRKSQRERRRHVRRTTRLRVTTSERRGPGIWFGTMWCGVTSVLRRTCTSQPRRSSGMPTTVASG